MIRSLAEEGCDAVVLGCTEIPLLVAPESSSLPTLDSTRLLAKAAVKRAVGTNGYVGTGLRPSRPSKLGGFAK